MSNPTPANQILHAIALDTAAVILARANAGQLMLDTCAAEIRTACVLYSSELTILRANELIAKQEGKTYGQSS